MSDTISAFCRNIYILRKYHRLTQLEMAKILGIGVGSLRKLESGALPPRMTVDVLFRIREHFGIRPAQILSDSFTPTK